MSNEELNETVNALVKRVEELERQNSEMQKRLDDVVKSNNGMVRYIKNSVKPLVDKEQQNAKDAYAQATNKAYLKELMNIFTKHEGKPSKSDFTDEQYDYLNIILKTVKETHPSIIHADDNEIAQMLSALTYTCVCLGVNVLS